MELITGIILLAVAYALAKRNGRKEPPPIKTEIPKLGSIRQANQELNDLIVWNAMQREAKAKAALRASLRTQGCTDADIEGVLKVIDGDE